MSDEQPRLDAPHLDEVEPEEERAAAALSRALDGGSADADLPLAALEMAALLRYSAGAGKLRDPRRAQIREELLSSLPRASAPRSRLWRWLGLGVPVACGATLVGALWLATKRERPEDTFAASEPEAAALTRTDAPLADQLARAAEAYRAALVPRLGSARLEQAHRAGDAALRPPEVSRADLERARELLSALAATPESHWSAADTRQVRQDLFCRLAEAALRLGQPDAALDWTRQGLVLDGPPTPFLAQLSALEGQAKAALGDRLGAAQSYMQALKVNEAMLDESLDGEQ